MSKLLLAFSVMILIGAALAVPRGEKVDNTPRFDTSSPQALEESTQRVMSPLYPKQRSALTNAIKEVAMHRIDPTLSISERWEKIGYNVSPALKRKMMEVMHGRSFGELVNEANQLPREGSKEKIVQHHSVF